MKDYLVHKQGVKANKLIDKGLGESRLLDKADPLNGTNRRVQITTLVIPEQ